MGRLTSRLFGLLALGLIVFLGPPSGAGVRGDFPAAKESKTTRPYPAVEITSLVFTEPRPLRVWAVKIDLTSPDIDFMVTPRGKFKDNKEKLEAVAVTTSLSAKRRSARWKRWGRVRG